MNLSDTEKQLLFQLENFERCSVLNELSEYARYVHDKDTQNIALELRKKLSNLSDVEIRGIISDLQKHYHFSRVPKTMGEYQAIERQKSGAEKLRGHDILDLNRFSEDTRHMVVFVVISDKSCAGSKGDKMRLFLTDKGYEKFLMEQRDGHVLLKNHAKVRNGHLIYDHHDHDL